MTEAQKLIRQISKRLRESEYTAEELKTLISCLESCDEENRSAEEVTGVKRSLPITHYLKSQPMPSIDDDAIEMVIGGQNV